MTEQKFYTIDEIAKLLRVSKETVRRLIADGELRAIHVRHRVRISQQDLDKYLSK
jgi:excisionase family DNA binding protein